MLKLSCFQTKFKKLNIEVTEQDNYFPSLKYVREYGMLENLKRIKKIA